MLRLVDRNKQGEVRELSIGMGNEVRWVPVATAAKILKVSRQRVHKLIQVQKLRSVVIDGTTLVALESIRQRVSDLAMGGVKRNGNR